MSRGASDREAIRTALRRLEEGWATGVFMMARKASGRVEDPNWGLPCSQPAAERLAACGAGEHPRALAPSSAGPGPWLWKFAWVSQLRRPAAAALI